MEHGNTVENTGDLRTLILEVRAAYARGENAMEFLRKATGDARNSVVSTLLAYDLQAGSYVAGARANPLGRERWCGQLAQLLAPYMPAQGSILEVGCGEATTLAGVLKVLGTVPQHALGFDISWSRCTEGLAWLTENDVTARLFVADLFEIPLEDSSVDVVYTSHSLEPNGGREEEAIAELLRLARHAVVLVEPIYELASLAAQARMTHHGYVRGLRQTAERLGAVVKDYRLLDHMENPLNPSGVLVLEKNKRAAQAAGLAPAWRCPLTATPLTDVGDALFSKDSGLAYPVLRGVPLLTTAHGVVASKLGV
jgi:SAM-dependent methyltransferase